MWEEPLDEDPKGTEDVLVEIYGDVTQRMVLDFRDKYEQFLEVLDRLNPNNTTSQDLCTQITKAVNDSIDGIQYWNRFVIHSGFNEEKDRARAQLGLYISNLENLLLHRLSDFFMKQRALNPVIDDDNYDDSDDGEYLTFMDDTAPNFIRYIKAVHLMDNSFEDLSRKLAVGGLLSIEQHYPFEYYVHSYLEADSEFNPDEAYSELYSCLSKVIADITEYWHISRNLTGIDIHVNEAMPFVSSEDIDRVEEILYGIQKFGGADVAFSNIDPDEFMSMCGAGFKALLFEDPDSPIEYTDGSQEYREDLYLLLTLKALMMKTRMNRRGDDSVK